MPFTGGTWEYTGDPSSSTKDEVRFLIQDTVESDPQISDEEIDYLILKWGGALQAAIGAARIISAKYARSVSKAVGDLRISYSDRSKQYQALAEFLADGGGGAAGDPIPYAGGISISDMENDEVDSDRVSPSFGVGQHDREGRRARDPLLGGQ